NTTIMAHPLLIKILNVLAYIFLLSANIYSVFEGFESQSPYHESHKTYISPALFVFGAWDIQICAQLLFFSPLVIYQFFPSATEVVVNAGNDISGALVIAWTLIGIFVEQEDLVIRWTALVLAVLSIFHIIKGIVFLIRRNRGSQKHGFRWG
ncbi:1587_t:CDS:2, partial [Racocetra persica]